MYESSKTIVQLKTSVKKHSDVTLSLCKANLSKTGVLSEKTSNQLESLQSQLSSDYLINIIRDIYVPFREVFLELKNYIGEKYAYKKKRKTEDSMEVTCLEETCIMPKKKPCKYEIWLWKDWRNKSDFAFHK